MIDFIVPIVLTFTYKTLMDKNAISELTFWQAAGDLFIPGIAAGIVGGVFALGQYYLIANNIITDTIINNTISISIVSVGLFIFYLVLKKMILMRNKYTTFGEINLITLPIIGILIVSIIVSVFNII